MKIGTLDISGHDIESLCRRWQIVDLAVFGSVLRDDFGPDSDVDLLVTFAPDAPWTLLDLVAIRDDFAEFLGRPVNLIERSTIETSPNWIRRREILDTAQPIVLRDPCSR
jgi:predicted nucleotidyltransferase